MQKIMSYIALSSILPFSIDTYLLVMDIIAASAIGRSTAIEKFPTAHNEQSDIQVSSLYL